MDVDEDGLKTPPEEAKLSRGLDNELPSPGRPTAVAARDAVLTTSLGPGAAIYVSRAYAVELELQDGSLDEEMPLEVTITQGLAFVNCGTEESGRWGGEILQAWLFVSSYCIVFPALSLTPARDGSLYFVRPATTNVNPQAASK